MCVSCGVAKKGAIRAVIVYLALVILSISIYVTGAARRFSIYMIELHDRK